MGLFAVGVTQFMGSTTHARLTLDLPQDVASATRGSPRRVAIDDPPPFSRRLWARVRGEGLDRPVSVAMLVRHPVSNTCGFEQAHLRAAAAVDDAVNVDRNAWSLPRSGVVLALWLRSAPTTGRVHVVVYSTHKPGLGYALVLLNVFLLLLIVDLHGQANFCRPNRRLARIARGLFVAFCLWWALMNVFGVLVPPFHSKQSLEAPCAVFNNGSATQSPPARWPAGAAAGAPGVPHPRHRAGPSGAGQQAGVPAAPAIGVRARIHPVDRRSDRAS